MGEIQKGWDGKRKRSYYRSNGTPIFFISVILTRTDILFIAVIQGIAENVEKKNTARIELAELRKLHTKGLLASLMGDCTFVA